MRFERRRPASWIEPARHAVMVTGQGPRCVCGWIAPPISRAGQIRALRDHRAELAEIERLDAFAALTQRRKVGR